MRNRLAFYDDLKDLATIAPGGVADDMATYLVAGWWSEATLDPLDGAETTASLEQRLAELGWRLLEDEEGGDVVTTNRSVESTKRFSLGLESATRYSVDAPGFTAVNQRAADPSTLLLDVASPIKKFAVSNSRFVDVAGQVIQTTPSWPRSAMLHGVIHGVPVRGPVDADQRPTPAALDAALGVHGDDVAGVMASAGLGGTDEGRRNLERVLSAFTGQLLTRLGEADGLVDVEEHEHGEGFASRPGGEGPIERLKIGGTAGPLAAGRAARGQVARTAPPKKGAASPAASVKFSTLATKKKDLTVGSVDEIREVVTNWGVPRPPVEPVSEVREVRRPAPRFHLPIDPVVGVRSARRSLRHRGDGRFSPDGELQCRWPTQIPTSVEGVVDGRSYIPSLANGALPPEVLTLARNALVTDPYLVPWLARAEAEKTGGDAKLFQTRLAAEAVLRFGPAGVYDGRTAAFQAPPPGRTKNTAGISTVQVADQLRRFSLVAGVDTDPVGVTAWSQPWIPLWLEWEAALAVSDRLEGWRLGQVDFESTSSLVTTNLPPIVGRAPLHTGTATTLAASIREWLDAEQARDTTNDGEADEAVEAQLASIADAIEGLDIVTASLDGIGATLLGLPVDGFGVTSPKASDGTIRLPVPVAEPKLLVGGTLRLTRARLVDAFGRTVDLPPSQVRVPARADVPDVPGQLELRPRLQRPARWLLRLVDPAIPDNLLIPANPAPATVDQVDPGRMVNPVAGFLLPDHIDESLEVFDAAGTPLGELLHEPIAGGVMWEIAPGREGPPDAPPLYELAAPSRHLGLMASAMVASDAQARGGLPAKPREDSALTALLRAIDTTLWTVDTMSHLGTEHIAGLVGRPVVVVRATLTLEIDDDLDELDLSDAGRQAARAAAFAALADRAFPVRLGELTRADDGLLAFFVDDDYTRVHVVDKVVRETALESRSGTGQLDQLGRSTIMPEVRPITHPYVVAEDELRVHVGQSVHLTLLMHPRSRVHLTSGILPRKYIELVRDWIQPGLSVMAPSVRVGPVLIDPDKVRLPKVSSFPKDQLWTRRDTPFTWKNDPILAATQTALLPDLPSSVQEGYIRVMPLSAATEEGEE